MDPNEHQVIVTATTEPVRARWLRKLFPKWGFYDCPVQYTPFQVRVSLENCGDAPIEQLIVTDVTFASKPDMHPEFRDSTVYRLSDIARGTTTAVVLRRHPRLLFPGVATMRLVVRDGAAEPKPVRFYGSPGEGSEPVRRGNTAPALAFTRVLKAGYPAGADEPADSAAHGRRGDRRGVRVAGVPRVAGHAVGVAGRAAGSVHGVGAPWLARHFHPRGLWGPAYGPTAAAAPELVDGPARKHLSL